MNGRNKLTADQENYGHLEYFTINPFHNRFKAHTSAICNNDILKNLLFTQNKPVFAVQLYNPHIQVQSFVENTFNNVWLKTAEISKDLDYGERLKKSRKTRQNQSSITSKACHYDAHVNLARSYDYFCNLTLFMI